MIKSDEITTTLQRYDFVLFAYLFGSYAYEKIDYLEICENTLQKLEDVRKYLQYIKDDLSL